MLVRDVTTGRWIAVPDRLPAVSPLGVYGLGAYVRPNVHGYIAHASGLGYYAVPPQQVIYDGFGNPVGLPFLASLLPFAGKIAAFLPQIASVASKVLPFLQGGAASPQGQPAPAQSPDMMAPPSMQPSMQQPFMQPSMEQPSMQPPMQAPMQPPMQPSMQPPMQPPIESPIQAAMAPPSSEPSGGPGAITTQEEIVMAPMRVRQPNGQPVVMSVPLRRRRRSKSVRFVRMQPAIQQRPFGSGGYAPEPASPSPQLQGWFGFNGWRGY